MKNIFLFTLGLGIFSFQVDAAASKTKAPEVMQDAGDVTCGCEGKDTVCEDGNGVEICREVDGYFCKPKEGVSYQRIGEGEASMDESKMTRGGGFNPFEGPYDCGTNAEGHKYCKNKWKRTVCYQ
ncbi:MAG: hypothetical protein J0L93_10430 [Deltaproteobacteria bacterium]|nr:hypothetical protein [Deltaproteobacteria bacterium]